MNLMSKGIDWFNTMRKKALVESVILKDREKMRVTDASVIEPETITSPQGIKVRTDKYIFLVDTAVVQLFDTRRGLQIIRGDSLYEVILDKLATADYNDPDNKVTALAAQLRPYNAVD